MVSVDTYNKAVRNAFDNHLAKIGFTLKEHNCYLTAEYRYCRIIFDPSIVNLLVQRISNDAEEELPIYNYEILMEPSNPYIDYDFMPMDTTEAINTEIDRMTRMFVENCQPILNGDDAAWIEIAKFTKDYKSQELMRLYGIWLKLKEDEHIRELPELESVRVNLANKFTTIMSTLLLSSILTILALSIIPATFFTLYNSVNPFVIYIIMTILLIIAVMTNIWVIRRALSCNLYCETNSQGLAIGKLTKNIFVFWDNIEDIEITEEGCKIITPKEKIILDNESLSNVNLEASIWWHLNRYHKANAFPLSPYAISLWIQIPEEKS